MRRPTSRPARRQAQLGTALIELTWLGLLLMIPLVYMIITVVTVQRSAFGATEAVRAAGRAYILAPDIATARQRAFQAAEIAMHDQGVELTGSELVISCQPTPDSCLQPGSSVEVRLRTRVALPFAPGFGAGSRPSIAVSAFHVEPYGVFREATTR